MPCPVGPRACDFARLGGNFILAVPTASRLSEKMAPAVATRALMISVYAPADVASMAGSVVSRLAQFKHML